MGPASTSPGTLMNKSLLGSMLFAPMLAVAYAQIVAAPPKPEERTYPITVTGRALDPDGKPVEGATIFLVSTSAERGSPTAAGVLLALLRLAHLARHN